MYQTNRIACLGALAFVAALPAVAYAAPAIPSAECAIRGVVEKVEERKVRYEPRSWADSYALPEFAIYTDVTVALEEGSEVLAPDQMTCQPVAAKINATYQWTPTAQKPKVGQTIKGTTQRRGDEFYIGHFVKLSKE
jgi:hypothetical protein